MAGVNQPKTPAIGVQPRTRIESVDILRGAAVLLMALGHTRLFFSRDLLDFYPPDLSETYGTLFLTQWVARFCSPIFFFLAGTAAFLSARRKSKGELARFLAVRGVWLIFLELTLVKLAWLFEYDYHAFGGSVLWAVGWSMIVLAGLVRLSSWAITASGIVIIATHNLFDAIRAEELGPWRWLWVILHEPGSSLALSSSIEFSVMFPLIPWIGVVAAGYGFGALLQTEPVERRKHVFRVGAGLTLAFVALRFSNLYGDPSSWAIEKSALFTVFSFINCQTSPPSLLLLLMTLGPSLIVLALLDRPPGRLAPLFLVFGRVPLFFYLVHLTMIHAFAVTWSYLKHGGIDWLIGLTPDPAAAEFYPEGYGLSLPGIYAVWLLVVAVMYPLCRWFAAVKQRRRYAWLSYF